MGSITKVATYTTLGLVGYQVTIEADTSRSLPGIDIIGLPDASIKEAKERIRSTFRNIGCALPPQKLLLNLAPSHLKKIGTRFDLPMAVALYQLIMPLSQEVRDLWEKSLFFGELGLDGTVKKIDGLLPSVIQACQSGRKSFFIPHENIEEIKIIPDIDIYPLDHFSQLTHTGQEQTHIVVHGGSLTHHLHQSPWLSKYSFDHIQGHQLVKRALTIAAAGMHNVLMVGPPGSGKTLLATGLQELLPPLTFEQILSVSQIYSVIGALTQERPLITHRPFRSVHHTASKISLVGGGQLLTPGEISLAHLGVLFLDELPEFPTEVLEVLRQPLEERKITISRAQGSVQYPADVMLLAAMNPCRCGYFGDKNNPCTCSLHEVKKYQSKISGPLLDRFDMILEIPREEITTLLSTTPTTSTQLLHQTIIQAHTIQHKRYTTTPFTCNAHLTPKGIKEYISLGENEKKLLSLAAKQLSLSPRVVHRTIKLARTIADIEGVDQVTNKHLTEALQYRAKHLFVL